MYLPPSLSPEKGYDVLIHFHGGPELIEKRFVAAKIDAVLLAVHENGFSSVYRKLVEDEQYLKTTLARIDAGVKERFPKAGKCRRVAISAFSAGYGAVRELLRRPRDVETIDAVYLADGLHAGYTQARTPQPEQMKPFVGYARRAIDRKAIFVATHSAIVPGSYASTTECCDYLLAEMKLERKRASSKDHGMVRTSFATRGGFTVIGFEGDDAPAHVEHLARLFLELPSLGLHCMKH